MPSAAPRSLSLLTVALLAPPALAQPPRFAALEKEILRGITGRPLLGDLDGDGDADLRVWAASSSSTATATST